MKPETTLTEKMQETMRPKSPANQSSVSAEHTLPQSFLDVLYLKISIRSLKKKKKKKKEEID